MHQYSGVQFYLIQDGLLPMTPSQVSFDKLLLWRVSTNFNQFLASPWLHLLSLIFYCYCWVNASVFRCAITFKSRWMVSNASFLITFWKILLMASLHQFKGDYSISRTAFAFIEVLLPLYREMQHYSGVEWLWMQNGLLPINPSSVTFNKLIIWNLVNNLKDIFPLPGLHWLPTQVHCL